MTDPLLYAAERLVQALEFEDRLAHDHLVTDTLSLARRTLAALEIARAAEASRVRPVGEEAHPDEPR